MDCISYDIFADHREVSVIESFVFLMIPEEHMHFIAEKMAIDLVVDEIAVSKLMLFCFDPRIFEHDVVMFKGIVAGMIEIQMQIISIHDSGCNLCIVKLQLSLEFLRHRILALLCTVASSCFVSKSPSVIRRIGDSLLPFLCVVFHTYHLE